MHAVDEAFADVDLDLQRTHVDDRADPGAREAAARGDGRDHLALLRGLDGDYPGERRAHDGVLEPAPRDAERGLGDLDGPLGDGQVRALRVVVGLRRVEVLRADEAALELLAVALEDRLGVREGDLGRLEARARLGEPGLGLGDGRALVRVVEPGDDLAGLDALAFLDEQLDDLAGHLRRDRRLPARDDVAGGIERRPPGRARARLGRLGDRDPDRQHARARHVHPRAAGDDPGDDDGRRRPPGAARARLDGGVAIDPQLIEQRRLVVHGTSDPLLGAPRAPGALIPGACTRCSFRASAAVHR